MPRNPTRVAVTLLTFLALLVAATLVTVGVRDYFWPRAAGAHSSALKRSQSASSASRRTKWKLVLGDNFDGPAGAEPSQKYWRLDSGKEYGIATDVASAPNVRLSGTGALVIEAIRRASGWTSGEVETKEAFEPAPRQAIMITAQIKLPSGGQGYWPAFWAVGLPFRTNPNSEPTAGEIDIAETINDFKWVSQELHCGPRKGGPCHENERGMNGIAHLHRLTRPSGSIGWNTYGWEWVNRPVNPYIDLTMNGVVQLTVSQDMIGAVAWHEAFDHPWYLIVNLAIGGGWPGPPSKSSAPDGSISIAHLRVYRS